MWLKSITVYSSEKRCYADIKNIVACQSLEMNLGAEMRIGKSDVSF